MTRGLPLVCTITIAMALGGCSEAPRKPAPVEDRTSQSKPPTMSSTLAKPTAHPPGTSKPSVAVVKPLAMPAEPKFIPIPVPEDAPAVFPSLPPAPMPDAGGRAAPLVPSSVPGLDLAAIPPAASTAPGSVEGPTASAEAGKQYRPNVAVGELLGKAKSLEQKRDFTGAIAILERGVQIAPNDPMLWHQLARMRFANGELAQAQRLAERSNSLARAYPTITAGNWMLIGQVEKLAGHADAAARAFSNARSGSAAP